jgi:hypothetical protein
VENTLTYKADTRLPLEVLEKSPFIYTGPNLGSFLVGAIQGALNHQGRLLTRVYPLTVYEVTSSNKIIDRIFGLCFFYVNDNDELVLFLTHPCWLNRSDHAPLLDFFLAKVDELANYGGCTCIEMEFHDIASYVAFPTSLTHFSYDLRKISVEKNDLSLLQSHGFQEESAIHCYEQSVNEIERRAQDEHTTSPPFQIKSLAPSEFNMLHAKPEKYPAQAYTLSRRDPFITFINPLSQDIISTAYTRPRWFRRGELVGYFRWTPNLFEPSLAYNLPVPLIFKYAFENYAYTYGKIVDWGVRGDDINVYRSLLLHASHSMTEKGYARLQIGNVHDNQSGMKTVLMQYDFKKVHTIKLLQKQVN